MTKALAVQTSDLISFDQSKLELIKKTIAKDLSDLDFQLFISIAKSRGLDPVLNQIHAVMRKDGPAKKMVIQVGIDGYRSIAARTSEYGGRDEAQFEFNSENLLIRAKVTVYRITQGVRCAFTATARWDEYCPSPPNDFMWKKMPETMLEKCAEAKALRMAFPIELGSLFVPEEIREYAPEARDIPAIVSESTDKWDPMINAFRDLGVTRAEILEFCGVNNFNDISEAGSKEIRNAYADLKNKKFKNLKEIREAIDKIRGKS